MTINELFKNEKPKYFFGYITREQSVAALANQQPGTYIIRISYRGQEKSAFDVQTLNGIPVHKYLSNANSFEDVDQILFANGAIKPRPKLIVITNQDFTSNSPEMISFEKGQKFTLSLKATIDGRWLLDGTDNKYISENHFTFDFSHLPFENTFNNTLAPAVKSKRASLRQSRKSIINENPPTPPNQIENLAKIDKPDNIQIPVSTDSRNNKSRNVIYYKEPSIGVIVASISSLPSSIQQLQGSLGDKIEIYQIVDSSLAEATNIKTGNKGFIRMNDIKIEKESKGLTKSQLNELQNPSSAMAINQRYFNQYEEKIGMPIIVHNKPIMMLKIDPFEIGLDAVSKLPEFLPELQCEIVSILREYFSGDQHIGFGFDSMQSDKKGFFFMASCYSA